MKVFAWVALVCLVGTAPMAWAQEKEAPMACVATAAGDAASVIVAVAGSENADPKAAAMEAAAAAIKACNGSAKGLVVFEDTKDSAAVAAGVAEAAKALPWIGCHAEALVSEKTLKPGVGVAVMAIGGAKVSVQTASADLNKQRRVTAKGLVDQLKGAQDPKVIFALSEPDLSFEEGVTVEDFLLGMKEGFPNAMLFGGNCKPGAGDKGIQLKDGKVLGRSVVAMAVSGPIKVFGDHTTEFQPIGKPVKVTKAEGKWVLELDGKPAAQVYREIRGMKPADELTSDAEHPIGVIVSKELDRRYNRMVLEWRNKDGKVGTREDYGMEPGQEAALRFIAEIPEGSMVQVMGYTGTTASINDSAKAAVADMLKQAEAGKVKPLVVMTSDCCTRGSRLIRFSQTEGKASDEVKDGIRPAYPGKKLPVFGFYAYGEIGPIRGPFQGLNYQYQQHTFVGMTLAATE